MAELSDHGRNLYLGTYTSEEHHGHFGPVSITEPVEQPRHFQGAFSLNDRDETESEWIPPVDEIHEGCRDESKVVRIREIENGDDVEHVFLDAVELPGMHRAE